MKDFESHRVPCDTVALPAERAAEVDLREGKQSRHVGRDALCRNLTPAQADFAPQRATFSYGLPYTRFNRIEGFSTALAADQVLGRGYSAHAQVRLGVADLSPNGELWLDRTDGRRTIGAGVYRRLVASNDWGDPLGFSSPVALSSGVTKAYNTERGCGAQDGRTREYQQWVSSGQHSTRR